MCISFIYCDHDSPPGGYKLIIASNRDESYERDTKSLHRWQNRAIIGGQDAVKGGTWLAASASGKIGILLNVLGMNDRPNGQDRGPIVVNYVGGAQDADGYLRELKRKTEEKVYNGFHTVLVELTSRSSDVYHFTNSPPFDSPSTKVTRVTENRAPDHVYGFGNSQCISQPFQKVVAGKRKFAEIARKYNRTSDTSKLLQNILHLMKNKDRNYPDPEIDRNAEAHMTQEFRIKYSGVCVEVPELKYGTRTHSIILVSHDNVMDFHEWTLESYPAQEWKHTHIQEKLVLPS